MDDVVAIRRWFAEDLRLRTPVTRNLAVIEAFATVPRERLLGGPGPWQVISYNRIEQPFTTPDAAPHWVYHDVLVAIDPARGLNNGAPSFWAHNLDHLDLTRGERVLQVGAGTGYYSAILAELVGPQGRVVASEHDAELAERARANLAPWPQVEVVPGDGRTHDPGDVDAVVAFAGSTHPAQLWLDRLAEGGRLLIPLTGENRWGFMLRAIRRGEAFEAASIGWVGIYPCAGGRDDDAATRLSAALALANRKPACELPIRALHRGAPPECAVSRVWYQAPGFWLERTPLPPGTVNGQPILLR
ncbi:MAG TPA: methyltransferase domain-containing protein [Xanthobacteraceae bacterium]|nr:methyltransferase domain-containing protein [Xanthobacteraceae bacterium]